MGRHLGQEFVAKRHHGNPGFSRLLLDRCVAETDELISPRHPFKELAIRQVSSLCPDWTNFDVEADLTRLRRVCETLELSKIQWENTVLKESGGRCVTASV